ncbi:MAG: hypothetical protein Q9168_003277 [Polycauliona sp. 1 TL-2023]
MKAATPKMRNFTVPKLSSRPTASAPHAFSKGLSPKDTELITKSVTKPISKAKPKSLGSEIPNSGSSVASQASTEEPPHMTTKATDLNDVKPRSAGTENMDSTIPGLTDLPAPSKAMQSNGMTSWLNQDIKALLDGQRSDIDRIAADVNCLMRDMKTVKAGLDYLKFQQKTFAEHDTAQVSAALAEDVRDLTRENRRLSESVAQLRTRPTEVEELREELKSLKLRMQCMENTIASGKKAPSGSSVHSTRSALRPVKTPRLTSHALSDPVTDSPTLAGPLSAQASLSRRTSAYSHPPDSIGNGNAGGSRDDEEQYFVPLTPTDDQILDHESSEAEEPQITSATKVAAQTRRRLSDSSSNTGPPRKKRGREPNSRIKPDWNTKPISLNNHHAVLTSDPEDDDYDPEKNTQERHESRLNGRPSKPGLMRMPTPEWEKPDWEGPSVAPPAESTRGRTTVRRGVSGRAPLVDRDAVPRKSTGYGNGDYVYFDSPQYWDDQSPTDMQADLGADRFEKPRDSEGRLIRQNGKVDGRSLRHIRAREEKARQAVVQQQLRMTSQDSKHVTEGQQKEMQAMGLTGPVARHGLVDAAALQAARNSGAASPAMPISRQPSLTSHTIKQGADETDGNVEGGPSTTTGVTAPRSQTDKHAALMKHVFPWR